MGDTISKQLGAGNSCVIQGVPLYGWYNFEGVKGRELVLYSVPHFTIDTVSNQLRAGNSCVIQCVPLYGWYNFEAVKAGNSCVIQSVSQ
jgi:hypothetical protein